jgi:DNA-nicking Smr family endonuclease
MKKILDMPRRKKRKNRNLRQRISNKEADTFNPALSDLVSLKKRNKKELKESEKQVSPKIKRDPDETQFFLEAMSDVKPLLKNKNRITPAPNLRPVHPARNVELEAMARLSDLVSGNAEMDITFSDEYIEGCVNGLSQKIMKRLKKGQFPIQDYIDLHGLTKQEAEIRMRDFLLKSQQLGLRCVLVVHGRGLNSENHIPVLKERLPIWLTRGPTKKFVMAFSTAMPYDGGTGAIYILLRKQKGGL